jgi:hypothetical protein
MTLMGDVPGLLLEYSFLALEETLKQSTQFYHNLSPEFQDHLSIAWSQMDIIFGVFFLFLLLFVLGSRKRKASWADVFLTFFWAAVAGSLLYFSFYQLEVSQFMVWSREVERQGKNPETETFQALLLMDMDPNLTMQSVLQFFELSGSRGRFFYAMYLFFDLFLLISTTILHRQVFSITYKGNSSSFMIFLTQRLPLAIAALDLYENSCLAVCLYYFSKMVVTQSDNWEISESFIVRIANVVASKWILIYLVVALQVLGLMQFFIFHKRKGDILSKSEQRPRKFKSSATPKKRK